MDSGASKLSISTSTQGGYYPDVPQSRSLGNEAPKAQSYIRSQNSSQVSLARRSWIMGFKLYSSDSQSSIGTSINTGQRSPKKQARRLTNKSFHSSPVKRGGGPSPSTLEVPEEHPGRLVSVKISKSFSFGLGLTVFTQNILEKKIIEFFPPSLKELGERVSLLPRPFMETSPRGRSTLAVQKEHGWTPKGTLVSHFLEHSSSVNSLRISPDQSYFITGSDDGTVRLWDTRRLETNVFNRSRIIYSGLGMYIAFSVYNN